jgi:hypothetical protein
MTMNKNTNRWMGALGIVALSACSAAFAQNEGMDNGAMTEGMNTTTNGSNGTVADRSARYGSDMTPSMAMTVRQKNAQMLIQTLSEEKTEINTLAGQQAQLKKMGGRENRRLAAMWGRWIREHKAAGPTLMRLIRQNGGDPNQARILKPPVLGTQERMLNATHMDHEKAVMTSQMRHAATNSGAIKRAMHKRANLARKHLRQMAPYHRMHDNMAGNDRMKDMNGQNPHKEMMQVQG